MVTVSKEFAEVSGCDELPDLSAARLRRAVVRRTRVNPGQSGESCRSYCNYRWIDQKSDGKNDDAQHEVALVAFNRTAAEPRSCDLALS